MSINSDVKKSKILLYFHIVLLETVLLLISAIISYHYVKLRSKQERINALTMQKLKITNSKHFVLIIVRVIILMT